MSDLDMVVEHETFEWHKVRKLALTARDFIYYFRYCYYQETKLPYSMKDENYARLGNKVKINIIDELILRGYGIEEMKEFVEWLFKSQKPVAWRVHLAEDKIHKWLKQKVVVEKKSDIDITEEIKSKRNEEENFARYLGEGYFDAQLTKKQYWLGLIWRKKNLTDPQKIELKQWQKENYDADTNDKLKRWRKEFSEQEEFDMKRQFFIELARTRSQKLIELLREFHRTKLYQIYSSKELEKEWS